MHIVENKILVFRTRNPGRYALIPKSRLLGEVAPGIHEVAVKWGLDEVKVLRNLGVKNVPSPIQGGYKWPGRFKPFEHQIATSSFLTVNNRAYVFNSPGCVDSETEYLSPTGWKKISEYESGQVAQYNLNGTISFVEPEEYVKLPCADMIHFKTKYGIDQMLSPEHRMLVYSNAKSYGEKYSKQAVMTAADMFERHEEHHAGVKRPNPRRAGSTTVGFANAAVPAAFDWAGGAGVAMTDAQLRLQIAVMADGYFSPSSTNRCTVRIKKLRKVERLRSLLAEACVQAYEREDTSPTGAGFFVFSFDAPLRLKKFDARFWECTAAQLAVVRDEVLHWDGSDRGENKGSQFFSVEKESADFVQFAFCSAGKVARITQDVREGRNTCYVVTLREEEKHRFLTLHSSTKKTAFATQSTDGFKYCFRVPSTFLAFRRNGCVFASGNTGKTLSCLWAADYLMTKGFVRRCLIVCPLSIMEAAWMKDIMQSVIHRKAAIAHSSSMSRRIDIVEEGYEFIIVNYDGVEGIAGAIKRSGEFDLIICDEANFIKNANTRRWKAINAICNPETRIWALTGTPAPQSPVDAYGLAKLVTPSNVPRFVTAWKDKVMMKVSQFKWIAKREAPTIVHTALQPAIRYTKEQCLDLPPVLTATRKVPMTAQQEKYYKLMKLRAVMQAGGETVTAVNAAVVINKLLQISCGSVYTDERETIVFDCKPRLHALDEILDDTDKKVLIFAPFRHSIDTIVEHLRGAGVSCNSITGDVTATKRGVIFNDFQNKPDPRVLVIQPQAAAHGVTLTAADTVVFWGPVTSVETYIQCIARADRIGQKGNNITVIHLQSSEIEAKMFKQLESRVEDHSAIVRLYDEELKETR